MREKFKYKVGQQVIYKGLIGEIESRSTSAYGTKMYGLVSLEDSDLTCTAYEDDCELYVDQEIDQQEGLTEAYLASERIRNIVGSVL